ncbi:MAG: recombination protein RecR [Acidobacteria bacterium 13_1_40CM_2_68_10]|nr:MAG: recombination protein RecR [Acidobacteria bacterium 13_1_40CM_2_68_10]OLE65422.1 MAG: recombination protein RecR [Acidobacteria bacterium 13_1_20CM_2_68_14]
MRLAAPLERLIEALRKLPGIGAKSAQRLAFHVLRGSRDDARALATALLEVKDTLRLCTLCFNVTDTDPCLICADANRDRSQVCVVEEPHNLIAIEKSGFRGLYHVLHGSIAPLRGMGPDDLKIAPLLERLRDGSVKEVILATNPNVEGEATAVYLSRLLKPLGVRATRIALGLPVGSELEYADEVTVGKALEGRREI